MKIINSKQQISDANASGRGLASAPQNIGCNTSLNSKKVQQNGRSMIEMLGVLAIIGVLSVGGIAGYSKAMMKYRINKTIEQITLIAGNVRAFWGPQKNYIGVDCRGSVCNDSGCYGHSGFDANGRPTHANNGCPIVKKAKIFPDEMITVTDGKIMSITNPFGGAVNLEGDSTNLSLWIDSLPIDACIELVSKDWSSADIDYFGVNYNNKIMYSLKPPVSVDDAVKICTKDAESDNKENMVFYFECKDCWIKYCALETGGCR